MRRKDSVNLGSQNTRREVMERGCCDSQLSTNVCRRGLVGGWWQVVRRGGVWRAVVVAREGECEGGREETMKNSSASLCACGELSPTD